MDREEALERVGAYRKDLRRRADAEYEAALACYEALADDVPIVDLGPVFRDCPTDAAGRPRLAIARADRRWVQVSGREWRGGVAPQGRGDTVVEFGTYSKAFWSPPAHSRDLSVRFPLEKPRSVTTGYAPVPFVPPSLRPALEVLRRRFVLFEVERWREREEVPRLDPDPYLLRRVTGTLYAIEASWDLTPLEAAILQQREPA